MPSTRRSALGDRILALMTSDWQDGEDVMERAIPMVPPGQAIRKYQTAKRRNDTKWESRHDAGLPTGPRRPEPSESDKIRQGARHIINAILGHNVKVRLLDVEVGPTRFDRRYRLSVERAFAHHCCLHGGSCRGTRDEDATAVTAVPEEAGDSLLALVEDVLESRRDREADPPRPAIREVFPGEIDRLLRECG